ncbi:nickel/cobalt transporter [Rhodovibrionaceae bacterium A322]
MPVNLRFLISATFGLGLIAVLAVFLFMALADSGNTAWSRLLYEIQTSQRDLHRQLAESMQAVGDKGAVAAWGLIVLSFLYGVFHAVGPGHGKVIISTYLLTQESQLRRGVILSLLSSLAQGVTAIVIVEATIGLLGLPFRKAEDSASGLEAISYGLVALVGLLLIVTRSRRLYARYSQAPHAGQDHHHHHDHSHSHSHDHGHAHTHAHDSGQGGELSGAEACSHCGHSHGPSQSDLEGPLSLRTMIGIILSVGIRPCSGAIIVLVAAQAMGLRLAGIAAVLAMSLGTGLAVSLLATLSVYARKASLKLAAVLPDSASRITVLLDLVGLAGGFIILVSGLFLLQSAWITPTHPLM